MKKLINRLISFVLLDVILISSMIFSAFGQNNLSNEEFMIKLADEIVIITDSAKTQQELNQITYENLDLFITEIQKQRSDIPDIEIAKFILQYTNQQSENLPSDIILRALESKEIVTQTDYIKVDNDGKQTQITQQEIKSELMADMNQATVSPQSSWTSSNGYMQIDTTCVHTKTQGSNRYYTVSATARWLRMPVCHFEDVLVIAHTGNFDASVKEFGYKYQTNSCCNTNFKYNYSMSFPNENISFDYPSSTGTALRFKLTSPWKATCSLPILGHIRMTKSISAYLTYGIIVNGKGVLNVRSAYCHKKIAVGSIGISCQSGGISFSLAGAKDEYNARPLTINVT